MVKKIFFMAGLLVALLRLTSHAGSLDEGLAFYLPFDSGAAAKVAGGTEAPVSKTAVMFEKGVRSEAAVLGALTTLPYPVKEEYFSFAAGAICLWVKFNYDDAVWREKVTEELKKKEGGPYLSWHPFSIYFGSVGRGAYIVLSGGRLIGRLIPHSVNIAPAFEKGKWTHLAFTWDRDEKLCEFYVNGEKKEGRIEAADAPWYVPDNLDWSKGRIGVNEAYIIGKLPPAEKTALMEAAAPENFTLSFDEVRMYQRRLSGEEVGKLFRFQY